MSQPTDRSATEDASTAHRYDARLANEIELRWQARWDERGTYDAPNPVGELSEGFDAVAGRPKLFVMDMFPYPSGSGLHVGHPLGYIGTDVYARFMRMRGYNVLHPFGYDAFGLPAEQYALETGQHPRVTAEGNVANMRRQLHRLGLGHDRRRELATTDVGYYRWTQWIFLQIFNSWFDEQRGKARPIDELITAFEAGEREPISSENPDRRAWSELPESERRRVVNSYRLAYVSELPVNWCPGLGTVLANEEVTADGRSDIGNFPVFRRALKQWVIRITAYAERLITDLDLVDWSESMKTIQRNWIGRSAGARIRFDVDGQPGEAIEVFTTRHDTLPGATYMVLSPEHPLVDELTAPAWPDGTPVSWRRGVDGPDGGWPTPAEAVDAYRRWAARRSDRERQAETDAKTGVFTGAYAVNPLTRERVPIFLADYVLMGYGTGAIMAVPAHDQRDFDFARLFDLSMREVVRPDADWFTSRELSSTAPVDEWPEAYPATGVATTELSELSLAGLSVDDAKHAVTEWLEREGKGEATVSYRLRDWLFARQRYWGEPFPIVYDSDGVPCPVPEDLLPIELPEMADFAPRPRPEDDDSDPEPPLARAREWVEVTLDLGDGPRRYRRDVNTMPQWAGSCWYYLRYLDPTNDERLVDPEVERYWMSSPDGSGGVDLYVGGVEHGVLHLLYARLWHKILYDLGHVSTPEPFGRLYNQGYIQAAAFVDERGIYVPAAEVVEQDGAYTWQGRPVAREYGKMGKSLKNSVSPDDIYRDYGADTLRLYEMAMGPLNVDRPWDTSQIAGVYRFLQRLWRNVIDEQTGQPIVADDAEPDDETLRVLHRTIARVRAEFEALRFNTAIASLIELNNHLTQKRQDDGPLPRGVIESLVAMVAPLAPHIAEELWERLGHDRSIVHVEFPVDDPALLVTDQIELPVQVDGKVRFQLTVDAEADAEALRRATLEDPRLERWATADAIARVVAVPGRIVNVVTR